LNLRLWNAGDLQILLHENTSNTFLSVPSFGTDQPALISLHTTTTAATSVVQGIRLINRVYGLITLPVADAEVVESE
jgi:hypothetical protein